MMIDKLYKRVEKNGHVCAGLDTSLDYIPEYFKTKYFNEEDIIFNFNKEIIDATYDKVACFKIQIAYYEALGLKGLRAYKRTLDYIKESDGIVISDIKRGDISSTAKMYARAHFEGDFETDFITLSPYMGLDSIEPYFEYMKQKGKGVFVLVRTSNEGAKDIEFIESKDGNKVYEIIGKKLKNMGQDFLGNCGYSSIGGVVGCTHIDEAVKLRKDLGGMFFLIPGYGAQGGKAEDVALYLKNGNGGVVNSSRGILLAYKKQNDEKNFAKCSRNEVIRMRDDILQAINSK
ncbi:orotidine 5'-phosphate decarboxylase [Clostridium tetani]|uniref:Orotidine 5'-phosphate decarboxylase n=1 Tax=Clostridium tetani (strain Massachusetts / E88) TaxID=212717 RepID=PYRF_CLOTE|nr:orotidine-5'-phosphate decarboxylase [Clostridium tetani]Q891J1.1 RecName: Full=Orotidine 5'-phosphate decarboxylase; AltName: Full=OMP decarboxylase; Short=OMPDCase; Short=OMPdecase [Clostridium tetani E88]AAO36854.1 orotidine 5-phosphate decarboxylase [Clostridium tetani E88]AVP53854.1 orotidine 5'-phosphate decarboxylase [Clostridium tetani]KGI39139.1 orotidine 5'-phosphate decarboxylase [Clostridium tetani ATCC 9441]KGI41240.1 orotidine 5'-phosphate decarboxylase [Clostridium tetani]KG